MSQALTYASETPSQPLLSKLGPRIDSLDLLRGFAILGIFLMNTWTLSMPQGAYTNPAAYNPSWRLGFGFPNGFDEQSGEPLYTDLQPLTGLNYYVFLVIHLFADMKFITTFSILFGAGILLQGERAAIRGRNPWIVHYSRMAVLLIFGLLHAYFVWYGDILTSYALCGILLFPIRRLPPALLTFFAMAMIATATFIGLAFALHWHFKPFAPFGSSFEPLAKIEEYDAKWYRGGINNELHAYRDGYAAEMKHRVYESLREQFTEFPTWTLWRCGGCMLLGMALHRRRFFHGAWSKEAYATIAAVVIPVGWMLTYLGVLFNDHNGWQDGRELFALWGLGVEFNYWGSLLCSFGYLCCGVLLAIWAADPLRRFLSACLIPIRSVGRMALSNYLFQNILGAWFFYGHGLGYFGKYSRAELIPLVLAMWAIQLVGSTLWLMVFRQGPFEYLWHSLVYWKWKNPLLLRNPMRDPTAETSV